MKNRYKPISDAEQEAQDRKLYDTIADTSPLETVIYLSLAIEHEMDQLLVAFLPDPGALKDANLTFYQKIQLVIAIGLDPRFRSALRALATIRNRFAHNLDEQFTKSDADNFEGAFDPESVALSKAIFQKLAADRSSPGFRKKKMAALEPLDRFRLFAVTLRGALRAGRLQVAEEAE